MTTDQAHQRAVWDQVKDQHHIPSSWQVKRLMTEDRVPAGARNARFVGIDVYEAAGGIVTRDLFAEDHEQGTWLDDPILLNTLATAKLEAAADAIRPDWKWVDVALDIDWQSLADYGRVDAIPGELTTEEQAEFERLVTRHDELTDDANEDDWTDALEDEYQTVTDRITELEAIPDERATFPDELQPHAGIILTIHPDATLRTIKGLIRPDDKQAIEAAATSGDDAPAGFHLPPGASHQPAANPEAEARKAAGLGNALCDDLRAIRTTIIKTHLAADFEAAFDLLLFQLARGVFTYGYRARALDITIAETADRPNVRAGDEDFAAHNPGEAALNDHAALPLDWLKIKDDAESFAALTNFHGLCLNARLPRVDTVAGHTWTVRADVQDCPQLELVLPARNEPVETPFLHNLRQAARAAIYRAIAAASPAPRMAYIDVQKAWALAITLPFPPHELPHWQPEAAHDHDWHYAAAVYHPTGAEPLLMTAELEPHDAQTFHRAAVRAGIADRLLEPRPPFDGFRWYGNIPRIRRITARISLHVLIERHNGAYESFGYCQVKENLPVLW